MNRIICFIFIAISVLGVSAQENHTQAVEGGFYAGATYPLGKYNNGTNKTFVTVGMSVSYNFQTFPIDFGLFMQLDCVRHGYNQSGYYIINNVQSEVYNYEALQNNRTLTIGLISNYNFRRTSKVNPFAGIGIGIGFNDTVGDVIYPSSGTSFVFSPRIGVEFWQLFRITTYANICRTGYNCIGVTLGVSFGGRPKQ